MTTEEIEHLIVLLKKHGVSKFRSKDVSIRLELSVKPEPSVMEEPYMPKPFIPPPPPEFKEAIERTKNILKLSPEELVEHMFPEEA